jgi:hypothetical protein
MNRFYKNVSGRIEPNRVYSDVSRVTMNSQLCVCLSMRQPKLGKWRGPPSQSGSRVGRDSVEPSQGLRESRVTHKVATRFSHQGLPHGLPIEAYIPYSRSWEIRTTTLGWELRSYNRQLQSEGGATSQRGVH